MEMSNSSETRRNLTCSTRGPFPSRSARASDRSQDRSAGNAAETTLENYSNMVVSTWWERRADRAVSLTRTQPASAPVAYRLGCWSPAIDSACRGVRAPQPPADTHIALTGVYVRGLIRPRRFRGFADFGPRSPTRKNLSIYHAERHAIQIHYCHTKFQ